MNMIDITSLKKSEIIERAKWRCPLPGHSKHNGLEHPRCYEKFKNVLGEKIVFFDIETEDLYADYGIMFCWCLLDNDNKLYYDSINQSDIKKSKIKNKNMMPTEDSRIIKSLIDRLSEYDRVVTHYGSRFDLKFTRTRAVICNIPFPTYGMLYQYDTWNMLRAKFKLRRNTLQNSTMKLLGESRKDHLSLSIKHGCLRGEEWALNDCLEHCKKDVFDLKDLYNKIYSFVRKAKTSI